MAVDADAQGMAAAGLINNAPKNSLPYTTNIDPVYFPNFGAGLANVLSGAGRATIVLQGDSTTAGYGAGTNVGGKFIGGAYAKRPTTYLASLLSGAGIPVCTTSWFQNAGLGLSDFQAYDTRVVAGAGWGLGTQGIGQGQMLSNSTTTNSLAFTPEAQVDSVTIYYNTKTGYGQFTTNVDGGASLGTTDSAGGAGSVVQSVTFTFTKGTHTINVQRNGTGGNVEIVGMKAWDSTTPAVDVLNWGVSGSKASNHQSGLFLSMVSKVGASFVSLDLGINDAGAAVTAAAYGASMDAIVTNAQAASCDVLLATPILGNTTTNPELYPQYNAQLLSIARNRSCGYFDQNGRFSGNLSGGGYTINNAVGYYQDGTHFYAKGYAAKARRLYSVINRAIG